MADKDIVSGLFGLTPEMYQQRASELDLAEAQRIGAAASGPGTMLSPSLAPFYTGATQRGQLVSRGIGSLLGVEDPELTKIRDVQAMRGNFDLSTPLGMRQFASALSDKGYNDLAIQAATKAATIDKQLADAEKARREPDEGVKQLIAKSTPQSVAKYLQTRNVADLKLVKEGTGTGKELTPEQKQAKQEDAMIAVDTVAEAKNLVSGWSTGYGSLLSALPMTDARKLQGKLDTIKSNLAAAMIEDLKSQSKTGATGLGALNKEELKVLQTSKASLDAGMGGEELNKSLNVIDKYFKRRAGIAAEGKPANQENAPKEVEFNALPKKKG